LTGVSQASQDISFAAMKQHQEELSNIVQADPAVVARTSRSTRGERGNQWCCRPVRWPSYPRSAHIIASRSSCPDQCPCPLWPDGDQIQQRSEVT
jgi:hypothetical protein